MFGSSTIKSPPMSFYWRTEAWRWVKCIANLLDLRDLTFCILLLVDLACGVFADGELHVSNYAAWSVQRELWVRHAVYSHQPVVWYRNTHRCLSFPAHLLQSESNKRVRGTFVLMSILIALLCYQESLVIHHATRDLELNSLALNREPIFAYTCWFKVFDDQRIFLQYLEKRFGKYARLSASIAYSVQMILYMGIVLYAPALAFESVIGIDKNVAIVIIGLTVIFYCCVGGIRAVLWVVHLNVNHDRCWLIYFRLTDVFQSLLMFVAIFLVIISGVVHAGGFSNIFKAASEGGRLELFTFNPDPTVRHSWLSLIIGGMFTYLSLYAVNQVQVQRLLTVKSLEAAQRALWWNWPILSALSLTTSFSGLIIYYFYQHCDPLLSKRISSRDQNMAIYIMDALGHIPGVAG